MPKDFVAESLRHHLLRAVERAARAAGPGEREAWVAAGDGLSIEKGTDGAWSVSCAAPRPARVALDASRFALYRRGDRPGDGSTDDVAEANAAAADEAVARLRGALGIAVERVDAGRLAAEEAFHDEWAASTRPEDVPVLASFEACTAPEHRYIVQALGDLRGKRLLDLGSGRGEASAYFALRGARVTACDLSGGMLDLARRVAGHHGVAIETRQAPAERTGLPDASFDVVYTGNLLHHVDIAATLDEARRVLVPGGVFVSWDPVAHNPVINVYRRMAGGMRTADEHPIRMEELELFRARFADVSYRCFWFFTLAVFLRFYLEGAHPSKERYWKKIVDEADRLEPFYRRLERWDQALLARVPWLQRWCWNIVVTARKAA